VQSVPTFTSFVRDYCRAFDQRLPAVLFSNNDMAIASAPFSLPFPVTHILCIWHLVDQSMKAAVGGTIVGGNRKWLLFRKEFMKVRAAVVEAEMESLFTALVQAWLPEGDPTASARRYMLRKVWSWRKKWA
jgi:hypothetical protein